MKNAYIAVINRRKNKREVRSSRRRFIWPMSVELRKTHGKFTGINKTHRLICGISVRRIQQDLTLMTMIASCTT